MFRLSASFCFAVVVMLAINPGRAVAAEWTRRPDFPTTPGRAGLIAGVHGGVLIAAGGASFPDQMPWEGGKKVYYDEIFILTPGETVWRSVGRLPEPRAYSAAISTADGVLVMGGENADSVFRDTLWLRWNGRSVAVAAGPELPAARTSPAAVVFDGRVFLAGGFAPGSVRASRENFWRLDLSRAGEGWQSLTSWPGPTRAQAVMASLEGAVYLISGLEMKVDHAGKPQPTYLVDAYRYRDEKWERLPDPPWSAIAAPSPAPITTTPARVFVLGGVDGRLVGKQPRDTRVPNHIMVFDVASHAWRTPEDRWPVPVVTAPAVRIGSEWWIVSGETMAGVRTTSVWSWQPKNGK